MEVSDPLLWDVGCALRRLVAKCVVVSVRKSLGEVLAPLQLGFGTPVGIEAAVHAAHIYLHNMDPTYLLLKLDFSNTFNTIRRDKILSSVLDMIPEIYPLVYSCCNHPSLLFFGNHTIPSADGVQHGDSLGPLLFSLTLHSVLLDLKSEFKVSYLDDGTLEDSLDDVLSDLHTIEEAAEHLGLSLNHKKSEIVCSDPMVKREMLSISPDFHSVDPADACLLGAPIGEKDSIDAVLKQKLDEMKFMGERLQVLFSHDALYLLTNAFSLPKILYLLRTSPCFCSAIMDSLDSVQRHLLESICYVHLSDNAWLQASLPVKSGGLGIRSFATLAPSAFLASAAGSSDLTKAILP